MPPVQRGVIQPPEGGPGAYVPGSVIRTAQADPVALAKAHGFVLRNPDRVRAVISGQPPTTNGA